jgi:sugar lactone lactonase YvrE
MSTSIFLPRKPRAGSLVLVAVVALLAGCGGGGGTAPSGPRPAPTYTIGGTLSGLTGQGDLKISLNGGLALALGASGTFRFPDGLATGASYAVAIVAQPVGQTCTVAGGNGVVVADVSNLAIACVAATSPVGMTAIGGTITGMNPGTTLTLVNNGSTPVVYTGSGNFNFTNAEGKAYSLSVAHNPDGQWCKVIGGAGIATAATTPVSVRCQSAQLVLLAGSGGGPGSADGLGTNARFNRPMGMVIDSVGNLFVADRNNRSIRKISPAGTVTTFAGSAGPFASVDGMGTAARFGNPTGIAIDSSDNLYVTDAAYNNVRKITPAGLVTTLVDKAAITGEAEVPGTFSSHHSLTAIVVDAGGSVYVADAYSHVIRKRTPNGVVATFAGVEGTCGHANGLRGIATLCMPSGLALAASGNLVVIDAANQLVRTISPAGTVSTLAGTAGEFGGRDGPGDFALFGFAAGEQLEGTALSGIVAESSGSVLVNDYYNGRMRRIAADGTVTTAAGLGEGYRNGAAASARFRKPTGLALGKDGQIFIAEDSQAIRKLVSGEVTTFAGKPYIGDLVDGVGGDAYFRTIFGMAVDASGNIFVADGNNNAIRKISAEGVVTTFAGRRPGSSPGDASNAPDGLNNPFAITIDKDGNVYVIDRSCVRKISKDGVISTLAGSPVESGFADGVGSAARFAILRSLTVDDNGNVYVADSYTLRKITPDGTVSTIARSTCDYADGVDGKFCNVHSVAVDRAGNLFFTDTTNKNIRKLAPDGIMSTVAGSTVGRYAPGGSADGQGASASFDSPGSIAFDSAGKLYVADTFNHTVRVITPAGAVSTLMGALGRAEVHEGPLPAMVFAPALTVGPDDQLYIGSANAVLKVKLQ